MTRWKANNLTTVEFHLGLPTLPMLIIAKLTILCDVSLHISSYANSVDVGPTLNIQITIAGFTKVGVKERYV